MWVPPFGKASYFSSLLLVFSSIEALAKGKNPNGFSKIKQLLKEHGITLLTHFPYL